MTSDWREVRADAIAAGLDETRIEEGKSLLEDHLRAYLLAEVRKRQNVTQIEIARRLGSRSRQRSATSDSVSLDDESPANRGRDDVASCAMSTQNRKRALRAGVALAIALQFLVPAIALTRTPPTRFGFQMYSGTGSLPLLTTVDTSGREQRVPLESITAVGRGEIDWSERAVHYLCRTRPTLTEVQVAQNEHQRTILC